MKLWLVFGFLVIVLSVVHSSPRFKRSTCTCDWKYDIVCGSDNVSYPSACWLDCFVSHDLWVGRKLGVSDFGISSVKVVHKGECGTQSTSLKQIPTPQKEIRPQFGPNDVIQDEKSQRYRHRHAKKN